MTEQAASIFGYFESATQANPSYDPGMDVLCPYCLTTLAPPVRTASLMLPGDCRSFFYRAHRDCAANATEHATAEIESALIDSRAEPKVRQRCAECDCGDGECNWIAG